VRDAHGRGSQIAGEGRRGVDSMGG
jgi:hypothetical protein